MGKKESGVTIMRMGTGLDTGDMISRIVVPIAKDETGGTLFDKLAEAGAKLLLRHCLTFLMAQLFTRNSRRKALLHMPV